MGQSKNKQTTSTKNKLNAIQVELMNYPILN